MPAPVGSGKPGTPFARMHAANLDIAFTHSAFCDGVSAGGPPPGRYFRHACIAAWNCGELGSTLPSIVTPPRWMDEPAAFGADPVDAENPWSPRQVTSAAVLAGFCVRLGPEPVVAELPVVVVADVTFATEGWVEPLPQPPARSPSPT